MNGITPEMLDEAYIENAKFDFKASTKISAEKDVFFGHEEVLKILKKLKVKDKELVGMVTSNLVKPKRVGISKSKLHFGPIEVRKAFLAKKAKVAYDKKWNTEAAWSNFSSEVKSGENMDAAFFGDPLGQMVIADMVSRLRKK